MLYIIIVLGFFLLVFLTIAIFLFLQNKMLAEKLNQFEVIKEENYTLKTEQQVLLVKLEEEKLRAEEKLAAFKNAETEFQKVFKALSNETLEHAQKNFFHLAKETFNSYSTSLEKQMKEKEGKIQEVLKPVSESLKAVDTKIAELEKTRISAYATVTEQLKTLATTQGVLQSETSKLVRALRAPSARGKWGEMQLRRVVEMAGMLSYCDFFEQKTVDSDLGRMRPDMIVKLPNSRSIVIDAKSPLQAYLEGLDSENEDERVLKLKEHAKQLKKHLAELAEKAYWEKLSPTPEFVVLFLPGEAIFSTALEQDPSLLEYGVEKKVLVASPTTLIALLRAVAYGWKEEVMAEHARAIADLGKTLHDRLKTMTEHFLKLKRSLDSSVDSYNKMVGSFESRVLPQARKFEELQLADKEVISDVPAIEKITKTIMADSAV